MLIPLDNILNNIEESRLCFNSNIRNFSSKSSKHYMNYIRIVYKRINFSFINWKWWTNLKLYKYATKWASFSSNCEFRTKQFIVFIFIVFGYENWTIVNRESHFTFSSQNVIILWSRIMFSFLKYSFRDETLNSSQKLQLPRNWWRS